MFQMVPTAMKIATTLIVLLTGGEFNKAVELFDPTMKQTLPAEKLQEIWGGLVKEHGPLKQATDARTTKFQQYDIVFVTCEFQHGKLNAKVVFNDQRQVVGLFFVPAPVAAELPPELSETAKKLVARLTAGEFDKAVEPFDETVGQALSAKKLQEIWGGLTKQFGPLKQTTGLRTAKITEKSKEYGVVFVTCEFQKEKLDAKIVFDNQKRIAGLFFVPVGE